MRIGKIRSLGFHVLPALWFTITLIGLAISPEASDSRLGTAIAMVLYWLYYPILAVVIHKFWFFFRYSEFWVYGWVVLGGTAWSYVLSFGTRFIFRKINSIRRRNSALVAATTP